MKLVEILARELEKWPEGVSHLVSSFAGELFGTKNGSPVFDERDKKLTWTILGSACGRSVTWCLHGGIHLKSVPSDYKSAIVTRADWEAERARIAKPAGKPNKDGWIRHRGGKCPVEAGIRVDYRMRNGRQGINERSELLDWRRSDESPKSDIMSYRIHKPAEQPVIEPDIYADDKDECSEPLQVTYHDADGPLQWRDRIREIDRTVEALEEERVSLIQRLECEGLQLLQGKVCAPANHAHDWQVSAVTGGKFIQAIKQHKNLYGSGLKEAKEAVEQYRDANTPSA